jgi:hypothetical protein
MWQELAALEDMTLDGNLFYLLSELNRTLVSFAQLIDEHLCSAFELPVIAINTMNTIEWTPVK